MQKKLNRFLQFAGLTRNMEEVGQRDHVDNMDNLIGELKVRDFLTLFHLKYSQPTGWPLQNLEKI